MKTVDETQWMAYVDGALDAADRAAVEAAMAADPQLAARVAAQQQLRGRLQRGLADELDEPVPARLAALLAPTPAPALVSSRGELTALPGGGRDPRARWLLLGVGLLAGLLLSRLLPQGGDADLRIDGRLAQALEQRLVSDAASADGWQPRLSFRASDGRYCRAFSGQSQAGLACKGGDRRWQLALLLPTPSAGGEMRQAASSLPPALLQAVDAQMQGETLDAAAEARARDAGWR